MAEIVSVPRPRFAFRWAHRFNNAPLSASKPHRVWDLNPPCLLTGRCLSPGPIFWSIVKPPKFWMAQIITKCNGAQIFSSIAVVAPAFVLVAVP
jgi:hypothetical protein